VALLASFQDRFLRCIPLNESIKLDLLAPISTVVVIFDGSGIGIADNGVEPTRQLNAVASRFRAKQFDGLVYWFIKTESSTRSSQCNGVAYFRRNSDDVRDLLSPFLLG
jgi:hypothetical protein